MDVFDTRHQGMEYQRQPLWWCRPHVVVVVDDRSQKATATPGAWRREAGSLAGDFLPSRKVGLSLNSWTLPRFPDTPPCIGTWAMGDGIITAGAQI